MARTDLAALARSCAERAERSAFGGTGVSALDPGLGTAACIAPMTRVYDYYGRLYLARPHHLLWAGLARLAGAPIVQGLATAADYGVDNAYCRMLADTCRRIFADVAWLHEAFVGDPTTAVELERERDRGTPEGDGHVPVWADIATGERTRVADANLRLLAREQLVVVQPGYDAFRGDARRVSRTVRAVHPYHDDFPGDDVGDAEQRWAWVRSMWDAWVRLPTEERVRLVGLSFEDLRARRFQR